MQFRGEKLTVTVFGQSHAPTVGMVMDGLPAGIQVDQEQLLAFMARRAPGQPDRPGQPIPFQQIGPDLPDPRRFHGERRSFAAVGRGASGRQLTSVGVCGI